MAGIDYAKLFSTITRPLRRKGSTKTQQTALNGSKASENFLWSELQCKCGCKVRNISPRAIQKLQLMREIVGKPFTINCAARCPLHNARVGGAPRSQHRSTDNIQATAFDISLVGHDKQEMIRAAEQAGFGGIGISYRTFIHVDDRGYRARW